MSHNQFPRFLWYPKMILPPMQFDYTLVQIVQLGQQKLGLLFRGKKIGVEELTPRPLFDLRNTLANLSYYVVPSRSLSLKPNPQKGMAQNSVLSCNSFHLNGLQNGKLGTKYGGKL
jgi:hypothetical protein